MTAIPDIHSKLICLAIGFALGFALVWISSPNDASNQNPKPIPISVEESTPINSDGIASPDQKPIEIVNTDPSLIELAPDEFVLPEGRHYHLGMALAWTMSTEVNPRIVNMLNLSKVEKSKVEEAMQECVSRLKEIEAEASQLVTDPEGGDYFLIEAREQEGEQERQALMAKITDTLGPKRSQVVNVLLKECDIFNKFLANDHTVSITEKQSAEGEPRYYFETGTISDGKLILHRTTLIQRDKFNERWGHLFQ